MFAVKIYTPVAVQRRPKHVILGLWILLLMPGIGCSHLNQLGPITPGSIASIQAGKTTKAEVLQRLGKPNWDWEPERAIAYRWEKMGDETRWSAWENRELNSPQASQWAFCIAFDKENMVKHHNLFQAPDSVRLKRKVQTWLEQQPKE